MLEEEEEKEDVEDDYEKENNLFQVFVYFTGWLQKGHKLIDKHQTGEPFKFLMLRF
jgi:hypothetical protein